MVHSKDEPRVYTIFEKTKKPTIHSIKMCANIFNMKKKLLEANFIFERKHFRNYWLSNTVEQE